MLIADVSSRIVRNGIVVTEQLEADIVVIGAGIAGAGVAADLASDYSVVILEQESFPGYHSTGRSAAIFIRNYGNAVIRALSRASAPLFAAADRSLFPNPLLSPRGILNVADFDGLDLHRQSLAEGDGLLEIDPAQALAMVPILNIERLAAAAYEPDAQDIDVAALHHGWLRSARDHGARLLTGRPVIGGEFRAGGWRIEAGDLTLSARIVVNAAGAWADKVAEACGVAPVGLQPKRRSIAVLPAPEGYDTRRWPLFGDVAEQWYAKPDGGRLFVSPADQVPVEPHDAFVDDLILAEGLDRYEQAVTVPVTHVERSWAGLRTFASDKTPVAGFDRTAESFFWLAGQGGYGIQTSPGLSRLAGSLIRRATPPAETESVVAALSPNRFRLA